MTTTDLLALADRVERATEPDGELEAEIWLAVTDGATRNKWSYVHKATGRECWVDETRDKFDHLVLAPRYMESLDAALALVPAGWIVELHRSFDDDGEFWSKAILIDSFSIGRGCDQQDRREVMSAGPGDLPCRIVATCLRARASTDKGEA